MGRRHAKLEGMAFALAASSSETGEPDLDNEAMALAEEAGEVLGAIRRRKFGRAREELGDVLRRLASIATLIESNLKEIEEEAITKMAATIEERARKHVAAQEHPEG